MRWFKQLIDSINIALCPMLYLRGEHRYVQTAAIVNSRPRITAPVSTQRCTHCPAEH